MKAIIHLGYSLIFGRFDVFPTERTYLTAVATIKLLFSFVVHQTMYHIYHRESFLLRVSTKNVRLAVGCRRSVDPLV